METSFNSQLPTYETKLFHIDEPAGAYDMLEVRCPRSGCRQRFWVKPSAWRFRVGVLSAACPYCFKAALVPNATDKPKVKTVKRKKRTR